VARGIRVERARTGEPRAPGSQAARDRPRVRGAGWIGYGNDLDLFAAQVAVLRSQWAEAGRAEAGPLIRPMLGIVDDDTLRRSFERYQVLGVDQVVLDVQAVEGDILAVLDRYCAALIAVWRRRAVEGGLQVQAGH